MIRLFWLWSLLGGIASANASESPPILISGFDDVLRQSENQNLFRAGLRLFSSDRTFAGMTELYTDLSDHVPVGTPTPRFFLVSGITNFLQTRVENFLREAGYPSVEVHTRSWIREWSVETFKVTTIRSILGARRMIVIFDDSEPSLEMAHSIPMFFPAQVLGIYLHEIVEHAPVAGARLYVTAFDVALAEHRAGRLSKEAVRKVADAVRAGTVFTDLIPEYAYCPANYNPCGPEELATFANECAAVRERVFNGCVARGRMTNGV